MITAIETILKTGSITNVFPKGDNIVNPNPPYVVLSGPEFIRQIEGENQGTDLYTISVHFNPGYTDDLDDYIFNEVRELLSGEDLTTRDSRVLEVRFEGAPSDIINNSDGTISKEQTISTVGIYGR
jgi:hypothetical protein